MQENLCDYKTFAGRTTFYNMACIKRGALGEEINRNVQLILCKRAQVNCLVPKKLLSFYTVVGELQDEFSKKRGRFSFELAFEVMEIFGQMWILSQRELNQILSAIFIATKQQLYVLWHHGEKKSIVRTIKDYNTWPEQFRNYW